MQTANFCPNCGKKKLTQNCAKSFHCQHCSFTYFHNTASAVAGIIRCNQELLLTQRKFAPGKGLLDLPGGFVDYNESLESALNREIKEELSLDITQWHYFYSASNQYLYKDVLYFTTDVFFLTTLNQKPTILVNDDVAAVHWFKIDQINYEQIAFPSVSQAIQQFIAQSQLS